MLKVTNQISQLINKGYLGKSNLVLSLFSKRIALKRSVNNIRRTIDFAEENINKTEKQDHIEIILEQYKGNNPCVFKVAEIINKNLRNELVQCLVHGSVGTYEEIKYSDFDGLVIIKDEVLTEKKRLYKTIYWLNYTLKEIYKFDPLQHHGWFVMLESDLNHYPSDYFPVELYKFSKSILTDNRPLNLTLTANVNYKKGFDDLANSIRKKICNLPQSGRISDQFNAYKLKGLLSQIMLLPSLYLQAKNRQGVFKKLSFDLTKQDTGNDFLIMDTISEIRLKWEYKLNSIQRYLLCSGNSILRRAGMKLAPNIPKFAHKLNDKNFANDVLKLIKVMEQKLELSAKN